MWCIREGSATISHDQGDAQVKIKYGKEFRSCYANFVILYNCVGESVEGRVKANMASSFLYSHAPTYFQQISDNLGKEKFNGGHIWDVKGQMDAFNFF